MNRWYTKSDDTLVETGREYRDHRDHRNRVMRVYQYQPLFRVRCFHHLRKTPRPLRLPPLAFSHKHGSGSFDLHWPHTYLQLGAEGHGLVANERYRV